MVLGEVVWNAQLELGYDQGVTFCKSECEEFFKLEGPRCGNGFCIELGGMWSRIEEQNRRNISVLPILLIKTKKLPKLGSFEKKYE